MRIQFCISFRRWNREAITAKNLPQVLNPREVVVLEIEQLDSYSTTTQSLALRPNTSGEYISSAFAGGTTKVPGVVARAI